VIVHEYSKGAPGENYEKLKSGLLIQKRKARVTGMSKKHNVQIIIPLCVALLCAVTGCGQADVTQESIAFDKQAQPKMTESGMITENASYRLEWDDENKRVELIEIETGLSWSTTPAGTQEPELDQFGLPKKPHPQINSALMIDVINPQDNSISTVNSYNGAIVNGRVSAMKISDGIEVVYYFDEEEISVPVRYCLREDSVCVTIDTAKIAENENKIYRILTTPFFCAVKNDSPDNYLFIPSGSGALSYPKTVSTTGITYTQEVFGSDPAVKSWGSPATEQAVRLPVYGAKSGDKAVCAIIESGAETASIEARYGSQALNYSSVYAAFQVRGYAMVRATLFQGNQKDSTVYSDQFVKTEISVGFYPLSGDASDYSGMAKVYSDYLIKSENMPENTKNESALNLIIYGGIMTKQSFLGIPYDTLYAATTLSQANQMITELYDATGVAPSVLLDGFGQTGLDAGKIAGGYGVNRKLGSTSALNNLSAYCKQNGIPLFLNFDMIRFSKSSIGFNATYDAAKEINRQTIYKYRYRPSTRDRDTDSRYALLSREKLKSSIEKLIKSTSKFELDGIGLTTLGSIAYSDYSNEYSHSKMSMSDDVISMMANARESSRKIAVSDANAYAASNADVIFEAPMQSTKDDIFDEDIPFYQMVFKGYIPLSSASVNLSAEANDIILKSLEGGCGLTYSLYNNSDVALIDAKYPVFSSGNYNDLKEDIIHNIKNLRAHYNTINGAKITHHEIMKNGVRKTTFDNGVSVYVNQTSSVLETQDGQIDPKSYRISEAQK